jgi:hypothetical protein
VVVLVVSVPALGVVVVVVDVLVVLRVSLWPNAIAPIRTAARIAAAKQFIFASGTSGE